MPRRSLLWAGLLGAAGIGLGAFGAHALEAHLTPERMEVWRTAVLYDLVHALALLALAALPAGPGPRVAAACFAVGTLLFSGSLFLLAGLGIRWLGAITPVGGLLLIAGWIALAWTAWRLPTR